MRRLLTLALISSILLAGCELKIADAKGNKEDQPPAQEELDKKPDIEKEITSNLTEGENLIQENEDQLYFHEMKMRKPMGAIGVGAINYNSTKTTISTVDLKEDIKLVNYYIWRTADGQADMKTFTSSDSGNNFSFMLDTKEFLFMRGEYQVEAYGTNQDGNEVFLGRTLVTFPQRVPILMYHAVDDYKGKGIRGLFVTPANFEAQMNYLKDNGFTLLTFERWGEINKVNKPILVTFDDGMKNNMNALRILQKLQDDQFHPAATLYMIAGYIDDGDYWLSSADLKEMVDSGIFSVQSHTMSHADLPVISNFEEELLNSKVKIEQVTGKPVMAIAYPFGHFDGKVVEETSKYYTYATTTQPGQFIEKGQKNEMMLMQRVRISYETTISQFAALVK